jgi:hypothetical protein
MDYYDIGKIVVGAALVVGAYKLKVFILPALIVFIIGLLLMYWGASCVIFGGVFGWDSVCHKPVSSFVDDETDTVSDREPRTISRDVRPSFLMEKGISGDQHCTAMCPRVRGGVGEYPKSRTVTKKIIRTDGPSVSNNNK